MGPRAAEAKSLYFEPSKRQLIAPPGPERQPMESWSLRESPNSLTATAVRRDDDTLHPRFEDSYRIQLRSVRAGTRLAACWTLPRPLAGRDWTLEQ